MKTTTVALAAMLCILITSTVMAQKVINPGGTYIKGGVNFSNISTHKDGSYNDANSLTSFNVGVLADLPVADVLSIQPGVILMGKGAEARSTFAGVTSYSKFNPLYIEVPVNIVLKLPVTNSSRLFAGAGPYGAVGVGGKWKTGTSAGDFDASSSDKIKYGGSNDDDLKAFDFGANFLAGIEISRLMIGVNYGLGFSKIFPNQDNSLNDKNKYRVFSINAGIRL